jgi:pSer/pThr/pTyr-binding forkhead associated (FHA) protein
MTLPEGGDVELMSNRVYIIGRQSTTDLPIADANISRQHAEVYADGKLWYVRDLGSTNGTSVNGQKITAHKLRDGDRISLGVSTLVFHQDQSPSMNMGRVTSRPGNRPGGAR